MREYRGDALQDVSSFCQFIWPCGGGCKYRRDKREAYDASVTRGRKYGVSKCSKFRSGELEKQDEAARRSDARRTKETEKKGQEKRGEEEGEGRDGGGREGEKREGG